SQRERDSLWSWALQRPARDEGGAGARGSPEGTRAPEKPDTAGAQRRGRVVVRFPELCHRTQRRPTRHRTVPVLCPRAPILTLQTPTGTKGGGWDNSREDK